MSKIKHADGVGHEADPIEQAVDPAVSTPPIPPPTTEQTPAEMLATLSEAVINQDYATVIKLAGIINKAQKSAEEAQHNAKLEALKDVNVRIQAAIENAIAPLISEVEALGGDGIWFLNDWGEGLTDTRCLKVVAKPARTRTTGVGSGKKFDISTTELLIAHGSTDYKDGLTFQQFFDGHTDGNDRYLLRTKLLKIAGYTE